MFQSMGQVQTPEKTRRNWSPPSLKSWMLGPRAAGKKDGQLLNGLVCQPREVRLWPASRGDPLESFKHRNNRIRFATGIKEAWTEAEIVGRLLLQSKLAVTSTRIGTVGKERKNQRKDSSRQCELAGPRVLLLAEFLYGLQEMIGMGVGILQGMRSLHSAS